MEHTNSHNKSFFGALSGVQGFVAGLIVGILGLCTIVLITVLVTGGNFSSLTGKGSTIAVDTNGNNPTPSPDDQRPQPDATKIAKVTGDDHATGSKSNDNVIVEYSDIQCPFCQRFHDTMKQVMQKNKNVKWVFRHFPLTSLHPQAEPAAVASECVADLGGNDAFWSFLDKAFANQQSLGNDFFVKTATDLGINKDKFTKCLTDEDMLAKVREQQADGSQAGVTGTPTSFINGKALPGAYPLEEVEKLLK